MEVTRSVRHYIATNTASRTLLHLLWFVGDPPLNPRCILSATCGTEVTVSWEAPTVRAAEKQEYRIMQLKTQFWDKEMQSTIPTIAMVGDELKYVATGLHPGVEPSTCGLYKGWCIWFL